MSHFGLLTSVCKKKMSCAVAIKGRVAEGCRHTEGSCE